VRRSYSETSSLRAELQDESFFSYPVKGFGRFDRVSQMTCCVTALAFHDAGVSYARNEKQDMGILGTNSDGCLQSNLDYFRDFVANGRTLGRANYFVYTLPSIPMSEAAIHFQCRGPLLYMTFPEEPVASLLRQADRMILRGESKAMLAVSVSEEEAQCFVMRPTDEVSASRAFQLERVIEIAERGLPVDELVTALTDLKTECARADSGAVGWRKRKP
jgi:hypothetical protein